MHMKSVVEQGFSHEFAFNNKALKHSLNFKSFEKVRSSTLSNSNSNFVTSLLTTKTTRLMCMSTTNNSDYNN